MLLFTKKNLAACSYLFYYTRLSDLENDVTQQKPKMGFLLTHHIEKIEPVVAAFGYVLFEMGVGFEMENVDLKSYDFPSNVTPEVKAVWKKKSD